MARSRLFGLGAVLVTLSAGSWLACSSSSPATPGTDGGTEGGDATAASGSSSGTGSGAASGSSGHSGATSGSGSSTGATSGASSGDGGASDAGDGGDAGLLTCTNYCNLMMTACTGANAQYQSTAECVNACALFAVGTAGQMAGDTLGCRITHGTFASTQGPVPHCWHAGPYGWGQCGDQCGTFCELAVGWCSLDAGFDGTPPYASADACAASCSSYATVADASTSVVDGSFNATGPAAGNTLDCREYHLGNALTSAANQAQHCYHVGAAAVGGMAFPCQ